MTPVLAALSAAALAAAESLLPGIYTNEEQVEFARAKGEAEPPWVGVDIRREDPGLRLLTVDAYGKPGAESQAMGLADEGAGVRLTMGRCARLFTPDAATPATLVNSKTSGTCESPAALTAIAADGLSMLMADGTKLDLLRARRFNCWASVPKQAPKADGSTDWWFKTGLPMHDRGGRLLLDTAEAGVPSFSLRMRNVVFPDPPNRPSLVIYVHGEDPVRAISYAWADPGATRLGINLRTMQASCTLQE